MSPGPDSGSRWRRLFVGLLLLGVAAALVALPVLIDPEATAESDLEGLPRGYVTGAGVEGTTIRLGVILSPGDSLDAAADEARLAGHRYYWEHLPGGGDWPADWRVELVEASGADPGEALASISSDVVGISLTDASGALVHEAARLGLPIAADSRLTYWGNYPHVVQDPLGSTYAVEMANAAYWAVRLAEPPLVVQGQPFVLVGDGGAYGADCASGLRAASEGLGWADPVELVWQAGTPAAGIAASLVDSGAAVVFACVDPASLAALLAESREVGFAGRAIAGSASYDDRLPALVAGGEVGDLEAESVGLALFEGVLVADSMPGRELPAMSALIDEIAGAGLPVPAGRHFLEGYRRAAAFDQLLRAGFARGDLTPSGLLAATPGIAERELVLDEPIQSRWFGEVYVANVTTTPGRVVARGVSPFGTVRIDYPLVAPWVEQRASAGGWSG